MSGNKEWSEGKSLLQVWFSEEEHERIKQAAAADHRSVSSFVRAHLLPATEEMLSGLDAKEQAGVSA